MRLVGRSLLALFLLLVVALATALLLVSSSPPRITESSDVFGYSDSRATRNPADLPALRTYTARDGTDLSYRLYDSVSDRILLFVHGSSYHGGGYHALGSRISELGIAKVVTPNLRGHYMSGPRRGDLDYIGQLEDDLRDLIGLLRREGHQGSITLGGHSSGGGLVIRFANGAHWDSVSSYLLLSPLIPTSQSVKGGDAGGWAKLHRRRLFGLLALNALGIHGFNALPIIEFNKPVIYRDGTETLSYSYRMNTSYHPRFDYRADIRAVQNKPMLLLVGDEDEAIDSDALQAIFDRQDSGSTIEILSHIDHFEIFSDDAALDRVSTWLRAQ